MLYLSKVKFFIEPKTPFGKLHNSYSCDCYVDNDGEKADVLNSSLSKKIIHSSFKLLGLIVVQKTYYVQRRKLLIK